MKIGTKLELVDRQTRKMEKIVYPAVPEAVASVVSVGASGWRPNSGGEGQIILSLVPAARRDRSNVEIAGDLRRRLKDRIPGMEIRVRAPQGQFLLERILGGDEGLTVEIRGFDLAVLGALVERVYAEIADVPGITDLETSLEEGGSPGGNPGGPEQDCRPGSHRERRHPAPGNGGGRFQSGRSIERAGIPIAFGCS